jgi:hypothetical protein
MEVTEPEPGRVLMETDKKLGVVTTFTVEPLDDGKRSHVTIATNWTPSKGVMGWLERVSTPAFMRKLYTTELQNVQAYVQQHKSESGGGFA